MAAIDTTVTKTVTKTISFATLKKLMSSKDCVDVYVPIYTKTQTILVPMPKKTVFKTIFKAYKTTDDMARDIEFDKVEVSGGYVIRIQSAI